MLMFMNMRDLSNNLKLNFFIEKRGKMTRKKIMYYHITVLIFPRILLY